MFFALCFQGGNCVLVCFPPRKFFVMRLVYLWIVKLQDSGIVCCPCPFVLLCSIWLVLKFSFVSSLWYLCVLVWLYDPAERSPWLFSHSFSLVAIFLRVCVCIPVVCCGFLVCDWVVMNSWLFDVVLFGICLWLCGGLVVWCMGRV